RILRALPSKFVLILLATAILCLVSPLLAGGSVSCSSILIDFSFTPILAVALACGMLSGLVCGIAITRFRVTALVATLAVNALLYGTVLYLTKGTSTEAVPP